MSQAGIDWNTFVGKVVKKNFKIMKKKIVKISMNLHASTKTGQNIKWPHGGIIASTSVRSHLNTSSLA